MPGDVDRMVGSRVETEQFHIKSVGEKGHWLPVPSQIGAPRTLQNARFEAAADSEVFRDIKVVVKLEEFEFCGGQVKPNDGPSSQQYGGSKHDLAG